MIENLVIVESPGKVKTIEKILGKEYTVKSSIGHVRDLPKKGIGVDVANNFEMNYEVSPDKVSVVSELKRELKKVKNVWLASDEDREGEAIAWHLAEILGLDINDKNRIVFHEITPSAIKAAIQTPRSINIDLVNAQQARRALDRLVGFELSPILWKKVKPSLSAGRVQSVAVRLVVEREREIIKFNAKSFFRVNAIFTSPKGELKTELSHRFESEQQAYDFIQECLSKSYSVTGVEKKPASRTPSAPFITSTLQQEASRKLGYSVSQTMRLAQTLYERGHITYMRTDSVNLSKDAIGAIASTITSTYGEHYLHIRTYKSKSKGAQEAHEAIRPTYFSNSTVDGTPQEQKLYSLIWKRAVASQMADAKLEKTTIFVNHSTQQYPFEAKGEMVVFDGFLKLYDNGKESAILPNYVSGDIVNYTEIEAIERFDQRPARFNEAALVKMLEELGIGRPSTFAATISTIINRGYVVKEDREGVTRTYTRLFVEGNSINKVTQSEVTGAEKSKLFPTDTGIIVNDYLQSNFPNILDYGFTANVEESFDDIAEGKVQWQTMLTDFYKGFHSDVSKAAEDSGGYATKEMRLLGQDPKSGRNIYARMGRFGAMVQMGENDDSPQYAGLKQGQLIETVTLDEAMDLFRLPRTLGDYEDKSVVVGLGRFGAYVRHDSKFVSIPKSFSPYTIDFAEAVQLIEDKRKSDREKVLKTFEQDDKLFVLNGRFGPYIQYDGNNYKVDKSRRDTLSEISFEEAMEIVQTTAQTTPVKRGRAKTATKSTTAKKSTAAKKTTATKKSTTKKAVTKKA